MDRPKSSSTARRGWFGSERKRILNSPVLDEVDATASSIRTAKDVDGEESQSQSMEITIFLALPPLLYALLTAHQLHIRGTFP